MKDVNTKVEDAKTKRMKIWDGALKKFKTQPGTPPPGTKDEPNTLGAEDNRRPSAKDVPRGGQYGAAY